MISPRGNAIRSSIAAAVSLNKASAMPAAPVGNMEKSLCIAPTLTISLRPDKREKGAKATTLLRGYGRLPENIRGPLAKVIRPGGGAEIKLPILPHLG